MPTVQELTASLIREAADALDRNVRAMPEDRLTWAPLDQGRTALDMVIECGAMNGWSPQILEARAFPDFDRGIMDQLRAEYGARDKALEFFRSGTDVLVAAVEAFPAGDLDDPIALPLWGGITKTCAEYMMIPYRNMTYHLGQIAYIQTLYGDKAMH